MLLYLLVFLLVYTTYSVLLVSASLFHSILAFDSLQFAAPRGIQHCQEHYRCYAMGYVEWQCRCVDQQDPCEAACLCVIEAEDAPGVQDEAVYEAGNESIYIDDDNVSFYQGLFARVPAFPAFGEPGIISAFWDFCGDRRQQPCQKR